MAVRRADRARRLDQLGARDRRNCAHAHRADHLPDADLHWRVVAIDRPAGSRVHGLFPADGGADHRRLCGAGPVPVLRLLRGRPHPDVPDHRHLGRRRADQGELQILPLHAVRLGADADRHDLHGRYRAYDVDPGADGPQFLAGSADLAVPCLPRQFRGQAADVAGPHLVARCARPGADRRLGDPRRRPFEARRLRLHPLLAADVPAGLGRVRAADVRAQRDRGRLHQPGRLGADRHEEADRLFVGRAHGFRHFRPVRDEPAGDRGRGDRDAQPRPGFGRALPRRRGGLRPPAHA